MDYSHICKDTYHRCYREGNRGYIVCRLLFRGKCASPPPAAGTRFFRPVHYYPDWDGLKEKMFSKEGKHPLPFSWIPLTIQKSEDLLWQRLQSKHRRSWRGPTFWSVSFWSMRVALWSPNICRYWLRRGRGWTPYIKGCQERSTARRISFQISTRYLEKQKGREK